MKNLIVGAIMLFVTGTVSGQGEMGDKEKMKVFAEWAGHWQGEGSIQMGPGEPKKSIVDEQIQYKLDGMIILVEGIGKNNDAIVHQALGLISYDKITSQYKMRSYLKDGRSTTAWLNVTADNNYKWGFDTPQGKVRYTIVIDPAKKTWNEIGHFSADGNNWQKFFEMNLKKAD